MLLSPLLLLLKPCVFICAASRRCNFFALLQFFHRLPASIAWEPACGCFVLLAVPGAITMAHASNQLVAPRNTKMLSWDPVYRVVKQIPRGRVLSYGALAKILR